jgi:hypothetical protein
LIDHLLWELRSVVRMTSGARSRSPSPAKTGPLDQQALETVRAAFRGVTTQTFLLMWSISFAVFAAYQSPLFLTFLNRVGGVIFAIEMLQYASGHRLDLGFFNSLAQTALCIAAAYFLLTVSHSDFLMTVLGALGVTVICTLGKPLV